MGYGLRNLCTPASIYLVISFIFIAIIYFNNFGIKGSFCLGPIYCSEAGSVLFVSKIIYILFWTWILNVLCNSGAGILAWIIMLLPLLLMVIFFILFLMNETAYIPRI